MNRTLLKNTLISTPCLDNLVIIGSILDEGLWVLLSVIHC